VQPPGNTGAVGRATTRSGLGEHVTVTPAKPMTGPVCSWAERKSVGAVVDFTPAVRAIWVAGLSSKEYTDETFGEDW